jgi:RsiW-degrading membrane proteinase PrsW (M82 family)
LDRKLGRLLCGSPLSHKGGKTAFLALLVLAFIPSTFASRDWVIGHPRVMLAGMVVGAFVYLPTLVALRYFDRRDRTPWLLALLVPVSVVVLFAPLAAACNDLLGQTLPLFVFVGLNEELAKVVPLLLLVAFVPRSVNGTRDGLIYGALGGLGFAIVEFGYYVAYRGFDEAGWSSIVNQIGRGNFLGTHNHILWSAVLGSAMGWAAVSKPGPARILVVLAAYLGMALTHSIEDAGGNVVSVMLGGFLLEPLLLSMPDPEATMQAHMTLIQLIFGTVNILSINIITLPVLLIILLRSGETERRVIREQLHDEHVAVISPAALAGVGRDRRFRSRTIQGLPGRESAAIVQLQNELAFHKAHLARVQADVAADAAVLDIRSRLQ